MSYKEPKEYKEIVSEISNILVDNMCNYKITEKILSSMLDYYRKERIKLEYRDFNDYVDEVKKEDYSDYIVNKITFTIPHLIWFFNDILHSPVAQ